MPHLLINLEDMADCEKGMQMLQRRMERAAGGCRPGSPGRHRGSGGRPRGEMRTEAGLPVESDMAGLPLPQKLKRIQSRGMWKHLVKIARAAQEPLSLPELDSLLELPKNKMRSLKAIMAKLENRFGIKFLKVDEDAGVDAAGNPRYIMLPNVRRQVLRLAGE